MIQVKEAALALRQSWGTSALADHWEVRAMKGYTEAPMAWGLTRGMGRVLGLDLAEAVVEGWLSRAELGQLVQACQACGRDAECVHWLSDHVSAPHLPDYCANHDQLQALLG